MKVALVLILLTFTAMAFVTPGVAKPFRVVQERSARGTATAFVIVGDATMVHGPRHQHLMAVFVEPQAFTIENMRAVFLLLSNEHPGEDVFQVYAFSSETEREEIVRLYAAIQSAPFGRAPALFGSDTLVNRPRLASLYCRHDRGEYFIYYSARGNSTKVELTNSANPCSLTGDLAVDLVRASRFCEEVVRRLLDRGADPNMKSRYGGSSLVEASLLGQTEIVELLLERGAYINQTSSSGWTSLVAAISRDHSTTIDLLCSRGADVNVGGEDGRTALIHAVQRQNAGLVKKLLARGADPGVIDGYGETALRIAEENHSQELIRLLREFGARR